MAGVKQSVRGTLRALATPAPIRVPLYCLTRAGLLGASVWKRLPVDHTFTVTLPDGATFRYHGIPADQLSRILYWRGLMYYEPETLPLWDEMARKATKILDVGANTGIFTLVAATANPRAKVVSFEPVPSVFRKLDEHVRLNQLGGRCELHQKAVGDSNGIVKFHIPSDEIPLSASFNLEGFRGVGGHIEEVPVATIDSICADGPPVELAKIDVEGFEDRALAGMERVLKQWGPTLIIECLPDGPYRAVDEILTRHGYRFYQMEPGAQHRTERILPDESGDCRNYLCTIHEDWRTIRPRGA